MENFDIDFYISHYQDLRGLHLDLVRNHFLESGINEQRIFNLKLLHFDYNFYCSNHTDLSNLNWIDACNHFLEMGIKEQRIFNSKLLYFDYNFYCSNHTDLLHLSWIDACIHFIEHGIKEIRLFNLKITNLKSSITNIINSYYKNEPCNLDWFDLCNYFFTNQESLLKYVSNYNVIASSPKSFDIINVSTTFDKEYFRKICVQLIPLINSFKLPNIKLNQNNETVLIEFRKLDNLEFIIKKMIITLPLWSHTIVCGNNNYDFISKICLNISNLKIIKLNENNINQNTYNNLLLSEDFWKNFTGEKILLYQEDSSIIHNKDNVIDTFLEYDYVGAPWPNSHRTNDLNVGNGGFSLRTKDKMIEIIKGDYKNKLIYSEHVIQIKETWNLDNFPEDVIFSKSLIDFKLGKVPTDNIASKFSSELIFDNDSIGGHCWYLFNNLYIPHEFDASLHTKLLNFSVIYSDFEFSIGGGEKYLSYIMKNLIDKGELIIFVNNYDLKTIKNTLRFYLEPKYVEKILIFQQLFFKANSSNINYLVVMSNSSYPLFKGCGKYNIYHCQFPSNNICDNNNMIKTYDKIIVNSEFTKQHLAEYYDQNTKIDIIYPPCNITQNTQNTQNTILNNKIPNLCCIVGRIVPNKSFDIAIKIFNMCPNMHLNIIGSIKDKDYYYKLNSMIKYKNIRIYTDIPDDERDYIIKKSKYFLNLTGFNYEHPFFSEHFGIAYIEALNYGCYPISINKGYPSIHIQKTKYGNVLNNIEEFIEFFNQDNLEKFKNRFIKLDKFSDKNFKII